LTQLWTIIFAGLLVIAFGLAHWLDCDQAKRAGAKKHRPR
jgi:uncharacterized membrane protein YidH (DUF202 family)